MEFLKNLFGTEALTYDQLTEKLKTAGKDGKAAKLADLSQGEYVSLEKHNALVTDRDGLKTQLEAAVDSLKAFEGIDPANIQTELQNAQKALLEAEKKHTADLAKRDSRAETEKLLSSHKFINDITREHYVGAIETALDDPANKGKSRSDIFTALTQEDGKPKAGIFLDENPNKLPDMPPAGGGAPPSDDFKFSFTPINR